MSTIETHYCTFSLGAPKIIWSMTRFCPVGCLHCFRDSRPSDKLEAIPVAFALAVARRVKCLSGARLILSGGEPLAVPNICDVLTILDKEDVDYTICTSLIGGRRNVIRELKVYNPRHVTVGIDMFHSIVRDYLPRIEERLKEIACLPLKANVCIREESEISQLPNYERILRRFSRITVSALTNGDQTMAERVRLVAAASQEIRKFSSAVVSGRAPECNGATCPSGKSVFQIGVGQPNEAHLLPCPERLQNYAEPPSSRVEYRQLMST